MKTPLIVLLAFFSSISAAETSSVGTVVYGDLMIEDQPRDLAGINRLQVSTGYDVTNPYLNTINLTLAYSRDISPLFDLGVEATKYTAQRSRYNDRLSKELQVFGVTANDDRPQYSALGVARLKLLQGRANLLSLKALPFRFSLKTGAGYIWHEDNKRVSAATWGFETDVFVTREWGVALRFDQDLENLWRDGDTIYRNRLALGLNRAF